MWEDDPIGRAVVAQTKGAREVPQKDGQFEMMVAKQVEGAGRRAGEMLGKVHRWRDLQGMTFRLQSLTTDWRCFLVLD